MFVNLFIGTPPSRVESTREKEMFTLEELSNEKIALRNGVNDRWLTFQRVQKEDLDGIQLNQGTPAYIVDQDNDICLAFSNCAALQGFHEKVTHDYVNLNPRFTHYSPRDNDNKDISQIFVNIDTSCFIPLIYEIPECACVKDTYHYGGHYYGFILEIVDDIGDVNATNSLKIYGYDKRLPKTHDMSCFHMIEICVDARFVTQDERKLVDPMNAHPDYYYTKHVISVSHSGMNKEERKKFFRMRSMYQKNKLPRTLHLTGPLFTKYIIGTIPAKAARELIAKAKEVNQVPEDMEFNYSYIPKGDFKDEKDWYENGIISQINELGKKKVRAVTVTEDIRIRIKDIRKAKIQQVLVVHEDGTITSILSNR